MVSQRLQSSSRLSLKRINSVTISTFTLSFLVSVWGFSSSIKFFVFRSVLYSSNCNFSRQAGAEVYVIVAVVSVVFIVAIVALAWSRFRRRTHSQVLILVLQETYFLLLSIILHIYLFSIRSLLKMLPNQSVL